MPVVQKVANAWLPPTRVKPLMSQALGFGKEARLLSGRDFSHVLGAKSNHVWRHQDTLLRILSVPSHRPRLGTAIAKRVMPRAVDRNRVKRLVREAFRCHQPQLPNRDYVVFARQNLRACPSKQIRHSLDQLMQAIISDSITSH